MSLDLTAAIEAAAKAMWDHTFEDGMWDSMTHDGENAQHCLLNAELALRAALPLIRRALAEEIEGAEIWIAPAYNGIKPVWALVRDACATLVRGGTSGGES